MSTQLHGSVAPMLGDGGTATDGGRYTCGGWPRRGLCTAWRDVDGRASRSGPAVWCGCDWLDAYELCEAGCECEWSDVYEACGGLAARAPLSAWSTHAT